MKLASLEIDPAGLRLARGEIYRYLGYQNARQVTPRTRRAVERQLTLVREWLAPRAAYRLIDAGELRRHSQFRDAGQVALAVCTAGEELEGKIQQAFQEGNPVDAVILDAIGSVAAEAVAGLVNQQIDEWARDNGLYTTRRFSPGYGDWPVEEQKFIFSYFPPAPAGVRLTPGGMMLPRKSVSFALKIGQHPMQEINTGRCPACRRRDTCAYRDDRSCAG